MVVVMVVVMGVVVLVTDTRRKQTKQEGRKTKQGECRGENGKRNKLNM